RPAAARSLSAITWNLLAQVEGDCPLLHHTVCFSPDYAAEFGALVHQRRLPARPTVYLCAQDRGSAHPALAPGTPERLLCLVNAPADGDGAPLSEQELAQCERQTFEQLKRCGVAIHAQPAQTLRTTPTAFDALFPGTGGA